MLTYAGADAFFLYDTMGFPIDLTQVLNLLALLVQKYKY
jgi:alanyl-tRNA synthetase